jgi:radical SAM protein (TIGR01212 family)
MSAPRYYSYSDYLRTLFGDKTYKVVVSSGLTCPTRDGTLAKRGCAFCDVRGSSSFHGKKGRGNSVRAQLEGRMGPIQERFGAKHFLAYFQSYTNTYADVPYLREIYEEALSVPGISGLCIGTRPDCLPDPVLELLEELASRTYVSLELGVQSFEDPSLEWLTRGHSGQCSRDAFAQARKLAPSVHTCAHLIFGSPTDAPRTGREAALELNALGVQGAKLHQLMVLENTELAERYRASPFPTLSLDEYAEVVIDFLEHLDPSIYIERLYATSTHPDECLAPAWSRSRWDTHNRLKQLLEERNVRQGARLLQAPPSHATPPTASPSLSP